MRMLWSIHLFTGTFKTAHRYVSQTRLSIRQNSYCCSHGTRTAQSMGARLLHQWSPTRVSCSPRDVPGQGELKMWSREQTHRGYTLYPKNFWHQASKGAESITKRERSKYNNLIYETRLILVLDHSAVLVRIKTMLKATCPIFWPSHYQIFFHTKWLGKHSHYLSIYRRQNKTIVIQCSYWTYDIQLNKLRQSNFI